MQHVCIQSFLAAVALIKFVTLGFCDKEHCDWDCDTGFLDCDCGCCDINCCPLHMQVPVTGDGREWIPRAGLE